MRIALSVDALEPKLTGIGRYTLELARGLRRRSEVEQLRFFRGHEPIADPEALLVDPATPAKQGKLGRWWTRRRGRAALAEMRSMVVHAPNFFLPAWVDGGIATIHDLSVFRFPETHPKARIEDFEARFAMTLARAQQVITGTHAIKSELVATLGLAPGIISVVPHGVRMPTRPADNVLVARLAAAGLSPGGYSLCVATIEPRKSIGELIDAYALLPRADRERFPLVIVGKNGWLADRIVDRIQQGTDEGWVRWLGFADDALLDSLYFGAHLFLYPSRYEGFGLPPVEAMAHGVPAIVSRDASLLEVAGQAALSVDVDDREAFALAISRGLYDSAWRDDAMARGLALAQSLGWDRTVELTTQVYRTIAR